MRKGISLPIRLGSNGRTIIDIESDDQIGKLLHVELSGDDDDNPFQDIGLEEAMIYDVSEPRLERLLKRRIEQKVNSFVDRAVVSKQGVDIHSKEGTGDTYLEFSWINLEKNSERDFNKKFPGAKR